MASQFQSRPFGRFFYEDPILLGQHIRMWPNIWMGANSYVNYESAIHGNTTIGRFCSIGYRCCLGVGNHDMNLLSTSSYKKFAWDLGYVSPHKSGRRPSTSTQIGHDVWIGWGAVVLQGVQVGTGAVIGANTVVTRDVPAYSIVVGLPGKVIRRRFPDEICDALMQGEWWTLPDEEIACLPANNLEKCARMALDYKGERKVFGSHWIEYSTKSSDS